MINEVIYLVAGGAVAYIIFSLTQKTESASVVRVKELREEALKLDKEIERLRNETTRNTIDFESKLSKHRARFGSSRQSENKPVTTEPDKK